MYGKACLLVNSDCHAHKHVLWALHHLSIYSQQVGPFQRLQTGTLDSMYTLDARSQPSSGALTLKPK